MAQSRTSMMLISDFTASGTGNLKISVIMRPVGVGPTSPGPMGATGQTMVTSRPLRAYSSATTCESCLLTEYTMPCMENGDFSVLTTSSPSPAKHTAELV